MGRAHPVFSVEGEGQHRQVLLLTREPPGSNLLAFELDVKATPPIWCPVSGVRDLPLRCVLAYERGELLVLWCLGKAVGEQLANG